MALQHINDQDGLQYEVKNKVPTKLLLPLRLWVWFMYHSTHVAICAVGTLWSGRRLVFPVLLVCEKFNNILNCKAHSVETRQAYIYLLLKNF